MDQSAGMGARLGWKLQGHSQPHTLLGVMRQIQQDFAVQALALADARPRFRRQVRLAFEVKWYRQIVHGIAQHLLHLGIRFPDDSAPRIVRRLLVGQHSLQHGRVVIHTKGAQHFILSRRPRHRQTNRLCRIARQFQLRREGCQPRAGQEASRARITYFDEEIDSLTRQIGAMGQRLLNLRVLSARKCQSGLHKNRAHRLISQFVFRKQLGKLENHRLARVVCERSPDLIWGLVEEALAPWIRLHGLDECLSDIWIRIDRENLENRLIPRIQRLTGQQAEPAPIENHLRKRFLPAPQRIKKLQEHRLPDQIRNITRRGDLPQSQNRILQHTLGILHPKRP